MTHAESSWHDDRPEDGGAEDTTGMGDSAGMDENTVLVESTVMDEGARSDHGAPDDGAGLGEMTGAGEATGAGQATAETSSPGESGVFAEPEVAHEPTGSGAPGRTGASSMGAGQEAAGRPANVGEDDRFAARWQEIQAGFVDDPRKAVQAADALVADMMERLTQLLASEREQLTPRGSTGDDVSTEDLRQGLRRYRSLFERLLAA
jgi:hypothetical protein